mmetsp:Transcript_5183/g.19429  ORF Transcript_5183/g.19429 Transcript_5183/m.19429 type:complete len:247 (-) Transcript_5183:281-1021(-)
MQWPPEFRSSPLVELCMKNWLPVRLPSLHSRRRAPFPCSTSKHNLNERCRSRPSEGSNIQFSLSCLPQSLVRTSTPTVGSGAHKQAVESNWTCPSLTPRLHSWCSKSAEHSQRCTGPPSWFSSAESMHVPVWRFWMRPMTGSYVHCWAGLFPSHIHMCSASPPASRQPADSCRSWPVTASNSHCSMKLSQPQAPNLTWLPKPPSECKHKPSPSPPRILMSPLPCRASPEPEAALLSNCDQVARHCC